MAEQHEQPAQAPGVATADDDFAAVMTRLERLVDTLESGELSLEGALAAFEEGVGLTRDAQSRLDNAELRVRSLIERADGGIELAPFPPAAEESDGER